MKHHLQAEADGRRFFRTYILFFIPILILSVLSSSPDGRDTGLGILSLFESYLTTLLEFSFFCYLITTLSYRNTGFPFSGTLRGFAPKAALWMFLTVITLGIYGPWYIRNIMSYILGNLSWNGKPGLFLGEPRRLLRPMLLWILLPLVLLSVLIGVLVYPGDGGLSMNQWILVILAGIPVILAFIHFSHIFLDWFIDFEISGKRVRYVSTAGETRRLLLGQLILCLITAGIYAPAAWLKIYSHITGNTTYEVPGEDSTGRLGFDGSVGEGFGFLWGQILLTLITVGIYGSWAMAKTSNWILNRTFFAGSATT